MSKVIVKLDGWKMRTGNLVRLFHADVDMTKWITADGPSAEDISRLFEFE